MKIKTITLIYLLILNLSCAQDNKQNKVKMEQQIKQEISQYKSFPNYSIQLDKGGCRVQLIGNEIPLYTVFEKGGFSALIPFNANILRSGDQILKIKIYPDNGKDTFDEYSNLSVEVVYYENDKNANSPRVILGKVMLPKEVIDKKLNYYEIVVPFKAEVPYNFSKRLESAKTISKQPNIEAKVLDTYKKIHSWLEKKDVQSLADFRTESNKNACLVYYLNTDKSIEERFDYSPLFEDKSTPDPFPKYKIVFYADGKLVRLERLDNQDQVLTLTGKTEDGYEITSDLSVLLYMPEGSEDLQQF